MGLGFAVELRLARTSFFMQARLQERRIQVHASYPGGAALKEMGGELHLPFWRTEGLRVSLGQKDELAEEGPCLRRVQTIGDVLFDAPGIAADGYRDE